MIPTSSSHIETIEAFLANPKSPEITPCVLCGHNLWEVRSFIPTIRNSMAPCVLTIEKDRQVFLHLVELIMIISTRMTFDNKRVVQNFEQEVNNYAPRSLRCHFLQSFSNAKKFKAFNSRRNALNIFRKPDCELSEFQGKNAIEIFRRIYGIDEPSSSSSSSDLLPSSSKYPESSISNPSLSSDTALNSALPPQTSSEEPPRKRQKFSQQLPDPEPLLAPELLSPENFPILEDSSFEPLLAPEPPSLENFPTLEDL